MRFFQPLAACLKPARLPAAAPTTCRKSARQRSVNPYNPFLGMWITVGRAGGRVTTGGSIARKPSPAQAIRFYTINNARFMFLEDRIGSLEDGKQADFIVVDRDLLTCPEDDIKDARALATYIDGKKVFRTPRLILTIRLMLCHSSFEKLESRL